MGSPQGWPPYASGRDCSIGFCSIYCPQWCYFYFPPPPPPSRSPVVISPLLIAIIVVVSTAFAVVAGYLIALRYRQSLRRQSRPPDPAASAPHPPPPAAGLDSSVINKLTIFRYRRGAPDGPVPDDDRDCSVCLGEFRDGDSLRLLPKCAHAFHKGCIDTWLSSHSNCPLCRAGVFGPAHEYRIDDGAAAPDDLEAGRTGGAGSVGDGDDDDDDYNDDEDDVVIEVGREEWTATSAAGESSSSPSAAESSVLGKGPPL